MKNIVKVDQCEFDHVDENFDVDELFFGEGVPLNLTKNFSETESEIILGIIEKSRKTNGQVHWTKVLQQFQHSGNEKRALKKLQYHYYNRRSANPRRITKDNNTLLVKLGLGI